MRSMSLPTYKNQLRADQMSASEAVKCLEENVSETFQDVGIGDDFMNKSSKGLTKEKLNNWGYVRLRSFCTAKEVISRMKRYPTWKKIFANHLSYEG